jgi:TetR/AcrR family transcriptional regulator, ethionamide resistance regulator
VASLTRRTEAQSSKRAAAEAAVLEATEALLAEGRSYAELPVEQIATRAGISRTAFYFYFRDKRELLMRLTEGAAELLYAEAEGWWSAEGDGPTELRRALQRILSLYREYGVLLRAVVEAAAYDDVVARFWEALVGRFVEATRRRIELEVTAGAVAPMPAQTTAFSLCWMTERACHQWLEQGGDVDDEQFVDGVIGVWLRSLYGR